MCHYRSSMTLDHRNDSLMIMYDSYHVCWLNSVDSGWLFEIRYNIYIHPAWEMIDVTQIVLCPFVCCYDGGMLWHILLNNQNIPSNKYREERVLGSLIIMRLFLWLIWFTVILWRNYTKNDTIGLTEWTEKLFLRPIKTMLVKIINIYVYMYWVWSCVICIIVQYISGV